MELNDGLVNLVSGMGTGRDKASAATYQISKITELDALSAYKSSSLARRVIDMPAEDACREWREWGAESDVAGDIEREEKRLEIQGKVMKAQKFARLFGGCALLIGDGAVDPSKPLDPATIRKGGLKYVTMLTMRDVTPGQLSQDFTSPNFGKPDVWTLNTLGNSGQQIHPSRLVVFHGNEPLGIYDTSGFQGWGESVLQGGIDAVQRVDALAANILSLTYEAKVDVVKIPDLMSNLATRGNDYSNEIIKRLTLAATGKGINGTLILDAAEEYEQKSASFSTLDTLLDRFMQLTSAAYGIPMTLLFGMSPGGLNATGAGDTRGYYDRIKVMQSLRMEPAMKVLDECLIWSALGSRPDDVFYNWRPLWQPTSKERAEVGKLVADTLVALDGMDILPKEAIGKAAVSALTESGAFPGLETAVDEYGGIDDDLGDDDLGESSGDDGSDDEPPAVTDARPMPVHKPYVSDSDVRAALIKAITQ